MLHSAKSLPLVTQGEPMLSSLFGWLSSAFSQQSSSVHQRRLHHSMLLLVATILLAAGLASTLQDNHKSQNLCSGFPQNILTIGFIQLTNGKPLSVIANDLKVYRLNASNLSMNVDLPVELDAWAIYPVLKELVKAIKAKQDAMNNSVIFQFRKNDTDNNSATSYATWLIHDGNKALFNWFSSKYGRGEQQIECKQANVDICKHNFVWILNDMPFILSDDGKKMFQFEMVVKDDNNKVSLDLRNGSQRNICSTQDKDGFSVKFTTANCNGSEVNWKVQKGFAYSGSFYFFDADKVRIVAMDSYNTSDSVKVNSVDYGTFFNCSKEDPTTTSTLAPNVTQSDPATATDIITSRSTPSTNMSTSMSSESLTNQTMSTDNLTTIAIDESTTEASNWTLVIVLSLVIVIVAIILIGGIVYYCYFYSTSTAKPKCNNNKSAKPKEKQDSTKKVQSTLEVKDGGSDVAKVESFGALRSDILLEEDIAVPSKSDMDWLSTSKAASAPAVAAKQQAKAAVLGKKQSKQSIVGGNEAKHHAISPKAATSHKNRAHEPDSARFGAKNSRSKSVTVLPVPLATNLSTQAPVSIRSAD